MKGQVQDSGSHVGLPAVGESSDIGLFTGNTANRSLPELNPERDDDLGIILNARAEVQAALERLGDNVLTHQAELKRAANWAAQESSTFVNTLHRANTRADEIIFQAQQRLRKDSILVPPEVMTSCIKEASAKIPGKYLVALQWTNMREIAPTLAESRDCRDRLSASSYIWKFAIHRDEPGRKPVNLEIPSADLPLHFRDLTDHSTVASFINMLEGSGGLAKPFRQGERKCFDFLKTSTDKIAEFVAVRAGRNVIDEYYRDQAHELARPLLSQLAAAEGHLEMLNTISAGRNRSLAQFRDDHKYAFTMEAQLKRDENYLTRVIGLYDSGATPVIDKGTSPVLYSRCYTLWIDDKVVLRCEPDGGYSYIATTAKKNPFRLEAAACTPQFHSEARLRVDLGMYDFCTEDGVKLLGPARDLAAMIFRKVAEGVSVHPPTTSGSTEELVERLRRLDGESKPLLPRHWGQEYLHNSRPEKIIQGELFGDKSEWKCYVFANYVISECNLENHATYVFRRDQFESLLALGRKELRTMRPEGFVACIVHSGNSDEARQAWREKVREYIR